MHASHLFLDTTVLCDHPYDDVLKYCQMSRLYLTEINIGEFKTHIKNVQRKGFREKIKWLKRFPVEEQQHILNRISNELSLVEKGTSEYFIPIPIPPEDKMMKRVFDKFFNARKDDQHRFFNGQGHQPPCEKCETKPKKSQPKSDFPDAFMLCLMENYLRQNQQHIQFASIISGDNKVRAEAERLKTDLNELELRVFRNFSEYNEYIVETKPGML